MTAHVAETPAKALDRADRERGDGPSDIHPIVDVIRRTTQFERRVRTSPARARPRRTCGYGSSRTSQPTT